MSAADGVVWDGEAWVVLGTPYAWDGTRWVDRSAPPATGTPPPPPHEAPAAPGAVSGAHGPVPPSSVGRGLVFGHVLWRVAVVCIGGGTAIAVALVGGAAVLDPPSSSDLAGYAIGAPFLGAILGLMLSVVAGPVIAGIGAWRLVPYPGSRTCRLTVRVPALVLVGLFIPVLFLGAVPDVGVLVIVATLWAAGLAGAWFLSPWVVRWYVRRMEPPARDP